MAMLGMLETLGITHGKPFKPDERMKKILTKAAEVGTGHGKNPGLVPENSQRGSITLTQGSVGGNTSFLETPLSTHRITWQSTCAPSMLLRPIGTAKAMVVSVPGQGSQYIGAYQDSKGDWLEWREHVQDTIAEGYSGQHVLVIDGL